MHQEYDFRMFGMGPRLRGDDELTHHQGAPARIREARRRPLHGAGAPLRQVVSFAKRYLVANGFSDISFCKTSLSWRSGFLHSKSV
jgi:hypothetical protein